MHSPRIRLRGAFAAFCAAAVCLGATTAVASADTTSVYPPGPQTRDFAGGAGGWTSSNPPAEGVLGGLCAVLCPTITDEPVAGGGVGGAGDGFIETKQGGLASVGVAAKASGIWESPSFTYGGAARQNPTKIEFSIARRAEITSLLTEGGEAVYSVELVDKSSATGTVFVINAATLSAAEEWKTTSASVNPSLLTVGDSYAIRVTTTFTTPVGLLPSGGVGYDNVALKATKVEAASGGNGGNGGNGSNGGNGNGNGNGRNGAAGRNGANGNGTGRNSSSRLSSSRLRSLLRRGATAAPLRMKGNRLLVKVSCPGRIGRACHIVAQGLLNRHRAATTRRVVKVGRGKGKRIVLHVKRKAKKKVAKRRRLLVREKVRAGKAHATIYKQRKLMRRRGSRRR